MYTKLTDFLVDFSRNRDNTKPIEDLERFFEENPKHDEYFNTFIDDGFWDPISYPVFLEGDQITLEAEWGGEGEGSTISKVFKWRDQLVELYTNYSSWDSTYWTHGTAQEVEAREVTLTRYFPKGRA